MGLQPHQPHADRAAGSRRGKPIKHDVVVDAARRVFLRHGFTGSGVDAIAAEAGVSKQTLYNHFGDKERLFREVIRAAQSGPGDERELARMAGSLGGSDDLGRDLRALGRHWVGMVLQEDAAALRRLIIAESGRHPWLLEEWTRPGAVMEQALAEAIIRQAERGTLDVPDAALAARQLILVVIIEALTRTQYGRRALPDAEAAEIVDNGVEMWLRCYRDRSRG
ncbi:TetR/AcrR family transcriptional regulator [Spongiactinospora rosea]|nr:TetR/AcrR family transcriptional regulator [Spongiactinospora rosea]